MAGTATLAPASLCKLCKGMLRSRFLECQSNFLLSKELLEDGVHRFVNETELGLQRNRLRVQRPVGWENSRKDGRGSRTREGARCGA